MAEDRFDASEAGMTKARCSIVVNLSRICRPAVWVCKTNSRRHDMLASTALSGGQ